VDDFFHPTNMVSHLNETLKFTTSMAARLVVLDRMNSPPWTFGPYAIPALESSNEPEGVDTASFIDVSLPVRRGYLACELVPQSQVSLNYTAWLDGTGVTVRLPMLEQHNCSTFDSEGQEVSFEHDGPFGTWNTVLQDGDAISCPTSYGFYGTSVGGRAEELNSVLCWSSIQELQALAQFSMPGWKVRSLQADESTMKNISSNTDTQLDLVNGLLILGSTRSLDGVFFTSLWNSTTKTKDASLLQYNNFKDLYARIQDIYGRATVRLCLYYTDPTISQESLGMTASIKSEQFAPGIKQYANLIAGIRHKLLTEKEDTLTSQLSTPPSQPQQPTTPYLALNKISYRPGSSKVYSSPWSHLD
jgi:hypothetical protein